MLNSMGDQETLSCEQQAKQRQDGQVLPATAELPAVRQQPADDDAARASEHGLSIRLPQASMKRATVVLRYDRRSGCKRQNLLLNRRHRHMFRTIVIGGPLLLAVAGCVSFEPLPLEPEQAAATLESRSFDDPSLRSFVDANLEASTNGAFGAWDLNQLTLAAYYFQPELDVARARRAVAEAARISAGEHPGIGAGVTPASNTTTSTPSPRILTLTADLTLETANKRSYRAAQAAQLAEAARLNITSVAWLVRSRVRESFLDLYAAIESQTLLRRQQTIQDDNLKILQGQNAAGAISAFELTQAKLAADSARIALRDAERLEAEARVRLAEAIGVSVRAINGIRFAFDGVGQVPQEPAVAELRERALLGRADILRALAEYAASQSALQLEIARQYPDLTLGPGYEYDQGDNKWSLGLAVSLPPDRNRGAIAEATARREESAASFNALQASVLGQIDLAAATLRAATAKQVDTAAMLADVDGQETIAQGMYRAGAISGAELAALQLQLAATELARFDALLEVLRAAGRLEDAIQAPLGLSDSVWESGPRSTFAAGGSGNQ
jgi:outer membrane protein TolC